MKKLTIASLVGAFLLAACSPSKQVTEPTKSMCVDSYVNGTLTIFADTKFSPKYQAIPDVSPETAKEITNDITLCSE